MLVEGASDRIALETLAARRGRELAAEGVSILAVGGAHAIRRYLDQLGPRGRGLHLAGLCDAGERDDVRRALEGAGLGSGPELTLAEMERLGFYVCESDLEDELIRALGPERVEEVLDAHGDLRAFRTFQKQPAWRGRRLDAQLRRFLGSADRRKIRYARILVEELDPARVPRPLDGVLAHVAPGSRL